MEELSVHLGKTGIAICIFYMAYYFLFRKQKYFAFNRVYLLASFLLSYVIPFVTLTLITKSAPVQPQPILSSGYIVSDSFAEANLQMEEEFNFVLYLFYAYAAGIVVSIIHLLIGYYRAGVIVWKSKREKFKSTEVYITAEDLQPFSFFNKIIVPRDLLAHPDFDLIIRHEKAHVLGKHTLDLLFAEILFAFQWFNPFAWLLKKAIKDNLEYISDHIVTRTIDPKTYQMALVSLADKKGIATFLNAFNGSQLKNRIIIMKQKTENGNTILRKLVVAPILVLLVIGLSKKEFRAASIEKNVNQQVLEPSVMNDEGISHKNSLENGTKNVSDIQNLNFDMKSKEIESDVIGQVPSAFGGQVNTDQEEEILESGNVSEKSEMADQFQLAEGKASKFFQDSELSLQEKDSNADSKVSGQVLNEKNGDPIAGVSVLVKGTSLGTVTDKDGKFDLMSVDTNASLVFVVDGFERMEKDINKNSEISVKLKQAENYNAQLSNKQLRIEMMEKILKKGGIPKFVSENEPVVIQDGFETMYPASAIVNLYNPDIIKRIEYFPTTKLNLKQADKAKNGVLFVTTTMKANKHELYIIDGRDVYLENQKADVYIYPRKILKLEGLSKESAVKKYGKKGKYGATIITTTSEI